MVPEIIVPAVHHIPSPGASTAREKGSDGPAQERRDSETLHEIRYRYAATSCGGLSKPDFGVISYRIFTEQMFVFHCRRLHYGI